MHVPYVEVPCNTTATIYIPAENAEAVKEGSNLLSNVKDIKVLGKENEYVQVEVGSGKYHFTVPYTASNNNANTMK